MGPGAYNTISKLVQKSSSAAGIGLGERFENYEKKSNCKKGPGGYVEHMNTFGKGAKGGPAWRPPKMKKQVVNTPGPGDYI